jgi:two-component sensor histidine kinase
VGEAVAPMSSPLEEFASIASALSSAAKSIEEKSRARDLLIGELNHRVKNTLAIVQSIVFQTLRGTELTELRDALTSRLHALGSAHDVLTRENWEGAQLDDIVRGAIAPHGGSDRFTVSGPAVRLTPSLSVLIAMLLHELATNAVKYGALSVDGGSVAIAWEVRDDHLSLRWAERGGPAVAPPTRQGFGSRLLESSTVTVGGKAELDFTPEGLRALIELPLRRESASPPAAAA